MVVISQAKDLFLGKRGQVLDISSAQFLGEELSERTPTWEASHRITQGRTDGVPGFAM
jgi:hypothetical protein